MNGSPQALTNAVVSVVAIVVGGGQELEWAIFARSGVAVVKGRLEFQGTVVKGRLEFQGSIVASPCQLPSPEMEAVAEVCKGRQRERKFRGENQREREGESLGEFSFNKVIFLF